ncbi:MAG: ABC transporter permease [Planctomycetes bacterium]|nr:ABC transporter permease [Planctomycetota bacterium]MCC7171297.1 ABC transporter permease [Planctomycetota bacterium]
MIKNLGILALLVAVCALTAWQEPRFWSAYNVGNTLSWTGLHGLLALGTAVVILTGGIDLSVGSVAGLAGVMLPWLVVRLGWPVALALPTVLVGSVAIGLLHGVLITRLRLQPFLVTLCGLLVCRGLARYVTGDATIGFREEDAPLRSIATATPFSVDVPGLGAPVAVPIAFLWLVAFALLLAVFLHRTVGGRSLFALGKNEAAARMSGVATSTWTVIAYAISAGLAGFVGVLLALDVNSVQPSTHAQWYELYAIAAAVLGGCSLRGGELTVVGVVLGAAILRVLYNAINILGIPTQLEFAVVGAVILVGAMVDEGLRRLSAR